MLAEFQFAQLAPDICPVKIEAAHLMLRSRFQHIASLCGNADRWLNTAVVKTCRLLPANTFLSDNAGDIANFAWHSLPEFFYRDNASIRIHKRSGGDTLSHAPLILINLVRRHT